MTTDMESALGVNSNLVDMTGLSLRELRISQAPKLLAAKQKVARFANQEGAVALQGQPDGGCHHKPPSIDIAD